MVSSVFIVLVYDAMVFLAGCFLSLTELQFVAIVNFCGSFSLSGAKKALSVSSILQFLR